jgi:hypothetical protein
MESRELNPKTGKPFKFGDVREDGYIFRQWGRVTSNGTRQPLWMSPKAFAKNREQNKQYQKVKTKELKRVG